MDRGTMDPRVTGVRPTHILRYGAYAGAAATAAGALPGVADSAQAAGSPMGVDVPEFEFAEATISELQAQMAAGRLTSAELTQAYPTASTPSTTRANASTPSSRRTPDALAIARRLDEERRYGAVRGPLHGSPSGEGQHRERADRCRTTAGSYHSSAGRASRRVRRGTPARGRRVILGKANLSEWANIVGSSRRAVGAAGPGCAQTVCVAPHGVRLQLWVGGGGGANLAASSLGTETDGSSCALRGSTQRGIKATLGLASRSGVIPIATARTWWGTSLSDVRGCRHHARSHRRRDRATPQRRREGHLYHDYRGPGQGRVAGAAWASGAGHLGFSPETGRGRRDSLSALADLGAVLVDTTKRPNIATSSPSSFTVLLYEFKHDLNAYLDGLTLSRVGRGGYHRLQSAHAGVELQWFGQELMGDPVPRTRN